MSVEQTFKRGSPSGYAPRGKVQEVARFTATVGRLEFEQSSPCVMVEIRSTSEARRTFRRALAAADCFAAEVEGDAYAERDGTFGSTDGRRDGAKAVRVRREEVYPCTFRVFGGRAALETLCESPFVVAYWAYVPIRVPGGSGGSGTPSPAAEKRIAAGRREGGERAADTERAAFRPSMPVDPQAETVRAVAPGADADTVGMVAELVRLAERSADLTPGERNRVVRLRAMLGL